MSTDRVTEIEGRLKAATEGPWKATFEEGDNWWSITGQPDYAEGLVCPEVATIESGGEFDADLIVNAPTDIARLLAAVDAVLGKHKPAGIYGECECDDETLDSPDHEPIGLMDMEACSNSFQFWACRECCFVNDYNTEECATYHVHTADKSQPCCPTVKAITEALGADR